jgi:hypothetical protein
LGQELLVRSAVEHVTIMAGSAVTRDMPDVALRVNLAN